MKVGDQCVMRGHGLVRITEIVGKRLTVEPLDLAKGESGGFELDAEQAANTLRELVSAEEARAALAGLATSAAIADERDVGDRSIGYRRALKSGDLAAQLTELGAIYRRREEEYPERQYTDGLERTVFAELAHVLNRPRKSLKAEIRGVMLGEKPPASLALPDRKRDLRAAKPPKLPGLRNEGKFAIDTELALGEASAQSTLPALHGVWFAYSHGQVDDDDHYVMIIHADHIGELATLARAATPCSSINSEGAMVSLCDRAMLEDREFVDAMLEGGGGVHEGRGFSWSTGGDGESAVLATKVDGRTVYVRVNISE